MARQGKCKPCKTYWVWSREVRLSKMKCPQCGGKLKQTTHLCKDIRRRIPMTKKEIEDSDKTQRACRKALEEFNANAKMVKKKRKTVSGSKVRKGVKLYKKFHGFEPESIDKVKVNTRRIPKTLVKVGKLHAVVYISNKFDGKKRKYIHRFKTKPILATNSGGDALYVLFGKFKVRPEGITG